MLFSLCFECDSQAEEQHHPIPQSLGGKRTIPLCSPCHGKAHSVKRGSIPALTKLGLERSKAAGVRLGRPSTIPPEILARIVSMREQGIAYNRIAEILTDEGVPTTRGGTQWWAATIHAAMKCHNRNLEHAEILAGLNS